MTYYQKKYQYDAQIKALEDQVSSLKQTLKSHTDLKSRELHVRRQEQAISSRITFAEKAEFYTSLKNILKKYEMLKPEWERLITLHKLISDPEDAAIVTTMMELIQNDE